METSEEYKWKEYYKLLRHHNSLKMDWTETSIGVFYLRRSIGVDGQVEEPVFGPLGERMKVKFPKELFSEDLPTRMELKDALKEVWKIVEPLFTEIEDSEDRTRREIYLREAEIAKLKREYSGGRITEHEYLNMRTPLENEIRDMTNQLDYLGSLATAMDNLPDIVTNRIAALYGEVEYVPWEDRLM